MLGLSNAMTSGSHHEQQYSLEFDGINDYLETFADGTLASKTYSFWMKASVTGENGGVFGHGGVAIGAFHINPDFSASNASKPLIYLDSHYWQYFDDTSAQDDGNWHHWAVYIKHDDLANSEVWVDGVALNTSTSNLTAGAVGANAYGKLKIGTDGDTKYFAGKIDEFAVFNGDLETDEVVAIYNNGKPFDLNYNRGNYVNSSDLEGYWRMFNGPFDDKQNGAVHDAHNPGFATGNVLEGGTWVNATGGWSTTTGGIVNSGTNGNFRVQGWGSTSNLNTIYQLSYTLSNVTDSDSLAGKFGSDSGGSQSIPGTAGYHTVYLKNTDSSVDNFQFISTHDWAGTITNISLRRLNGYPGRTSADATFSTDTPDD